MCLYVLMRSTESLRRGADAGSRNCLGILDCIVCRSDDDPAADDPPNDNEELAIDEVDDVAALGLMTAKPRPRAASCSSGTKRP